MDLETVRDQLGEAGTNAGNLTLTVDHYTLSQYREGHWVTQACTSLPPERLLPFAYANEEKPKHVAIYLLSRPASTDPRSVAPCAEHIFHHLDDVLSAPTLPIDDAWLGLPSLVALPTLHPDLEPGYTFPDVVTKFSDRTDVADNWRQFPSPIYKLAKAQPATLPRIKQFCTHPNDDTRYVAVAVVSNTLEDELREHGRVTDRAEELEATLKNVLENEENENIAEFAHLGTDYAEHVRD